MIEAHLITSAQFSLLPVLSKDRSCNFYTREKVQNVYCFTGRPCQGLPVFWEIMFIQFFFSSQTSMVGSHESAFLGLPLCKTHISGFLGKHVYRSITRTSMGGLHESALLPFWENHIHSPFQIETAVESTGYSK